jgi:hypothetical protein
MPGMHDSGDGRSHTTVQQNPKAVRSENGAGEQFWKALADQGVVALSTQV